MKCISMTKFVLKIKCFLFTGTPGTKRHYWSSRAKGCECKYGEPDLNVFLNLFVPQFLLHRSNSLTTLEKSEKTFILLINFLTNLLCPRLYIYTYSLNLQWSIQFLYIYLDNRPLHQYMAFQKPSALTWCSSSFLLVCLHHSFWNMAVGIRGVREWLVNNQLNPKVNTVLTQWG